MKGRLRLPLIFGLITVAVVAAIAAAFPIHLTTKTGVSEAQVREGIWERIPTSVPGRVEVDNPGDGPVRVGFPALRFPEIFTPDLIQARKGVSLDETGQTLEIGAGGFVSFSGVLADLDLTLLPGQTDARLEVTRTSLNETTSTFLTPEQPAVSLQSPRFRFERTLPFLWRTVDPGRAVGEGSVIATIGRSEVVLGPGEVLDIGSSLPLVSKSIGRGLLVVVAALALMFWFWLLGRALSGRGDRQWLHAVNLTGGLALSTAIANSLSYLLPVKFVILLIATLWVGVLIFGIRRGNLVLDQLRTEVVNLGGMAGLALIPAALLFLPMFFLGSPFLGGFNTDLTAQYSQASSLVTDHSLLVMQGLPEAQNAGMIPSGLGFEWRSIDVVFVALASLGFDDSLSPYELVSVLLYLVYSVGLFSAVDPRRSKLWGTGLTILLLLFPPFVALFMASYWTQIFFVALIPGFLLAATNLSSGEGSKRRPTRGQVLLAAALLAAILLSFPFFAVLVAVGVVATLLSRNWCQGPEASSLLDRLLGPSAERRTWVITLTLSLLLVGPGILSLILSIAEASDQTGLNEITRNVLLAPYDVVQRFGLIGGVVPYGWRQVGVEASPFMGGVASRVWESAADSWTVGLASLSAVLIAAIGLLAGIDWKKTASAPSSAAAASVVAIFALSAGGSALSGNSYLSLKLVWTGLCLIPLLLVLVRFRRAAFLKVFVIALIPLAVLWVRVDLADRAVWFFHTASAASSDTYAPVQEELWTVRDLLAERKPSRALVLGGSQPIAGSDRDITVGHQLVLILRDQGISCMGCETYLPAASCEPSVDLVVTVGKSGRGERCGLPPIYSGDLIDVYATG